MRTHTLVCVCVCVTLFVLQFSLSNCQTKRLQKGCRKENKINRLVCLFVFKIKYFIHGATTTTTVARNLGI